MHLVKWFRKNNTKIMAVVVIVLMVGFVGGSALTSLLRGSGGANDTIAYYGKKTKITRGDVIAARQELELLQALRAEAVLRAQLQTGDLYGALLSELLFSESRSTPEMVTYLMQIIRRNQYRISEEQLSDMYRQRTVIPAFYWLLLRDEATAAGIHIDTSQVRSLLGQVIPRLFNNQGYSAVMQHLMNRYHVSEENILNSFGRLLGVLQHAQLVCATGNLTDAQIRHFASQRNERLNAELVQLEASVFADKTQEPSEDEMLGHFNKYRSSAPGAVTKSNPFGFGYKLPARVQIEYIAVKLTDVASIIKPPTDEETEAYYQSNREELFTEQVKADPNDPNSMEDRAKPYLEVYNTIVDQLKHKKITTKAEQILQEARNVADAKLQADSDEEKEEKPTVEELKKRAEEYGYAQIAEDLGKKYNIPLYDGRTGLLDAVTVQMDDVLGRLYVPGYGPSPIRLTQVLFSAEPLEEEAVTLMFSTSAGLYTSIGPAQDPMIAPGSDLSDQIMAVVRITQAKKSTEPENLDVTFSTKTLGIGDESPEEDTTFSVREKVLEDLRKVAAWDTTKSKAEEFVATATKDGWDAAVASFNKLYGEPAKEDPNDPNVFELQQLPGLQRISSAQLQVLGAQTANNPAADRILTEAHVEREFISRLFSLVRPDAEAPEKLPDILEFKPNQSFYCLKDISVQRLNQQQYQAMKGMLLRQQEQQQTQSLAVVHFNPANILKRTQFRPAKETQESEPAEDQAQTATEEDA